MLPPEHFISSIVLWWYFSLDSLWIPLIVAYLCQNVFETLLINPALMTLAAVLPSIPATAAWKRQRPIDLYSARMMQKDVLWAAELELSKPDLVILAAAPRCLLLLTAEFRVAVSGAVR